MEEQVTKDDLRQFGLLIIGEVRKLIQSDAGEKHDLHPEWLKAVWYVSCWICQQVLYKT